VNGGLFSGSLDVPRFSRIARSYLLHIGNLDWTKINPDIFGSMIQAVAEDEERGALGLHYTSVPKIGQLPHDRLQGDAGDRGRINKRRGEADRCSEILLTNFRGIELRNFPAEIARLALNFAEYQCDVL
jgi:hypothetical protein